MIRCIRLAAVAAALTLVVAACGTEASSDTAVEAVAPSTTAKPAKDVTEADFDRRNFPTREAPTAARASSPIAWCSP